MKENNKSIEPEKSKVKEPALLYNTNTSDYPCQYSIEELQEKFREAIRQAEAGEVFSHEDVKNRHKKK